MDSYNLALSGRYSYYKLTMGGGAHTHSADRSHPELAHAVKVKMSLLGGGGISYYRRMYCIIIMYYCTRITQMYVCMYLPIIHALFMS